MHSLECTFYPRLYTIKVLTKLSVVVKPLKSIEFDINGQIQENFTESYYCR